MKAEVPRARTPQEEAALTRQRMSLSRYLHRLPAERALHVVAAWIFHLNLPRAKVIAWLEELLVDLKEIASRKPKRKA